MLISEVIRKKRDGQTLTHDDIAAMVAGIADGGASDAQVAAFAMAAWLKGLSPDETAALTLAMRDSGDVFQWSDLPGPVVDKHSTGGVGDNVSLMLAPILAACGAYVPMISGRGLGHTGGTLDKMDAIPGYVSQPDNALFDKVVREVGCAIIGQTGDLAPADKRLYAIRDVTATVESIPLITASILSKKLAAGLGSLVMDVKFGSGAFMSKFEDARELAASLQRVATLAGLPCHALLTDMNEPLADAAGNAVETLNAIEFLTGARRTSRLEEVVIALCAQMLVASGIEAHAQTARSRVTKVLVSGHAAEVFGKMVAALGGPADVVEHPERYLAQAPVITELHANDAGYVSAIDARVVGLAVVELGGGRRRASDQIDPAVGLTRLAPLGAKLEKGDPIAVIHAANTSDADTAKSQLEDAYRIGASPKIGPVVAEVLV
ncbi:thymidine phosphorylase [Aliiroseovarius halocynthiae]|uniref:Thymidine phosphorylase n=1 Tax=Aliiroseovarius halocynthiae TaxID=985055 RepID=A0A545SPB1_9RHOB|nr:thymidine phosphorylase [Aliiroseovarius halocynthiae]TQV66784.1 thymidine phosphorylase [Aliiroseovarius halocynthiae]SMR82386.1 thymidine phosphorylase [Aliiroseovarius halocynthiae]